MKDGGIFKPANIFKASLLYHLQIAGRKENVFLHLYLLPLNKRAVAQPTENYEADQE